MLCFVFDRGGECLSALVANVLDRGSPSMSIAHTITRAEHRCRFAALAATVGNLEQLAAVRASLIFLRGLRTAIRACTGARTALLVLAVRGVSLAAARTYTPWK